MSTAIAPRRRRRTVIHVYNPSMFSDDVPVGGTWFHFEPHSVGTCICAHHQREVGEDPTGVHDLMDWPRNERGKIITEGGLGSREVTMTAEKVAEFIVSPDCRGDKGFVILEGTPEEQEEQKRAATQKWVNFHLADVEQQISEWEAHVAALRSARPGDPPPRRPRRVVAAYTFRDKHLAMIGRAATYVCDLCGWDALEETPAMPDTAENLADHRRRRHPGAVAGKADAALAGVAAEAAAPPESRDATLEPMGEPDAAAEIISSSAPEPGDRPAPKEGEGQGAAVGKRAVQYGLQLSVADKKGLKHDDPDVIADVESRIEVARKAAKTKGRAPVR